MSIARKCLLALAVALTVVICIFIATAPANSSYRWLMGEYEDAEQRERLAQSLGAGIGSVRDALQTLQDEHGDVVRRMSEDGGAPEIVAELCAALDRHGIAYGELSLSGGLTAISGGAAAADDPAAGESTAGAPRELIIALDVSAAADSMTRFCDDIENGAKYLFRIERLSLSYSADIAAGSLVICCYMA